MNGAAGTEPVRRRGPATIFAFQLMLMSVALVLWAIGVDEPLTPDIFLFPAAFLAFGAVGALILSRDPSHRIGRLATLAGFGGAVIAAFDSVARLAQPVTAQDWAGWIAAWAFPLTLAPPLLLVLVFPTGRLASRPWAIAAALIVVGVVGLAIGNAFTPTLADYPKLSNPVGIDAFAGSPLEHGGVAWLLVLGGASAAGVGLITRLRQAHGVERQQLKWIAFAAGVHVAAWVTLAFDLGGVAGDLAGYAVFATLLLIPLAAGVAITRHRLYDIDVVIRRTLVYGALVTILGLLYGGLVIGLQSLLAPWTGDDILPVAVSTLVIAAVFGPLRSSIRSLVDRRFYRAGYDAEQVVRSFSGTLRHEFDADAMGRAMLDVTARAVHPTSASVWIRGGGSGTPVDPIPARGTTR
jgi:hypothetical protein